MSRALGAAAGFLLDRLLGEPPLAAHPVALFGRVMSAAERRMWGDDRASGVLFTAVGVVPAFGVGLTLRRLLGAGPSTAVAAMMSIAGRMLNRSAIDVSSALGNGDLGAARALLPTLVGRDASQLDHSEIARATIESVADNAVDAVIAPLWWGAIAGAPGILAHRAINT
ncbi:MAG: cobalamin biosynthesis protein, partial [Actinomycetota bacterium]|nr:cobalamin biosynthesis protein [Actinomycetota bacterium]